VSDYEVKVRGKILVWVVFIVPLVIGWMVYCVWLLRLFDWLLP
jgi:heme/copper-type cytochrome/quinol oxidase subunit 2